MILTNRNKTSCQRWLVEPLGSHSLYLFPIVDIWWGNLQEKWEFVLFFHSASSWCRINKSLYISEYEWKLPLDFLLKASRDPRWWTATIRRDTGESDISHKAAIILSGIKWIRGDFKKIWGGGGDNKYLDIQILIVENFPFFL